MLCIGLKVMVTTVSGAKVRLGTSKCLIIVIF